jgi:hypothetical protein
MNLTKSEIAGLPIFAMESAFCRHHLKIDPMTFRRYFALGLIQPNAATSSGRPLFLATAGNLAAIRKAIRNHKRRQQRKLNAHWPRRDFPVFERGGPFDPLVVEPEERVGSHFCAFLFRATPWKHRRKGRLLILWLARRKICKRRWGDFWIWFAQEIWMIFPSRIFLRGQFFHGGKEPWMLIFHLRAGTMAARIPSARSRREQRDFSPAG